jgi:hypothetical protein
MISWKSLHVEVYRDTHDQASTSGDGDQHELLGGSWMISRVVPRRMRRSPMIVYPIQAGLFSPRGRSPKLGRCRRTDPALPREAASTTISGCTSGEPSCSGIDHLLGDDGSC